MAVDHYSVGDRNSQHYNQESRDWSVQGPYRPVQAEQPRVTITQGTGLLRQSATVSGIPSGSGIDTGITSKEKIATVKDMKGVSGQLTRFNEIDIVKLTGDKALNRNIFGQQSFKYDQIRKQA